jgi:hypothetical protein
MKRLWIGPIAAEILPILTWILSLISHRVRFGAPFVWNEMAYMPLFIIAAPLRPLYEVLNIETHWGVFFFAWATGLIYALCVTIVVLPIIVRRARQGRVAKGVGKGSQHALGPE